MAGSFKMMPGDEGAIALPSEVLQFQQNWHAEILEDAWRYHDGKQLRKALEFASEALRVAPRSARGWATYGTMLMEDGQLRPAVESFRRALSLRPDYAEAWSQLGETLRRDQRFAASDVCHRRAIALSSNQAVFHYRRARNLVSQGQDEAALPIFEHTLQIDPNFVHAAWQRGECLRRLGDLERGWRDYELRFDPRLENGKSLPGGRRWAGERFDGETLLVVAEQGFGDAIWGARYFASARALGGRLVVQCRRELQAVFAAMDGVDEVVDSRCEPPPHDLFTPLCSLFSLFAPTLQAVSGAPYLAHDPIRAAKFARWLGLASGRLKVGLIWSGSVYFSGNDARSLPLEAMVEAFDLPGVQLYALQKSPPSDAMNRLAPGVKPNPVIDLGPLLEDFADTAAVLAGLDLLIMTESATAHLAGALGRPIWILLNRPSYWLWGQEGDQTPWYNSMRLFRTPVPGAWGTPLDLAAARLMELAGEHARLKVATKPS